MERTVGLALGALGILMWWVALAVVLMALAWALGACTGVSVDWGSVGHGMVPSGFDWIGGIGEALRGVVSSWAVPMPLVF